MALLTCPECDGRVSDAAAACPHCGYPIVAADPGEPTTLDALGPELADEVRAVLRQAGLGDAMADALGHANVTVGKPVVSTRVYRRTIGSTTAVTNTAGTTPPAMSGLGYDYRSKWTLLGLPLLAMSKGYDPATGRKRVARGMIAVGDVAVGGLAIGGAAFGLFAVGGVAVGVVSLGGLAIGLLLAIGGGSVGFFAVGGGAFGYYAFGGLSLGVHTLSQHLTTHTGR